MMLKKTKIVASISDLRCDVDFIRDLFNAGMNVVRMNTAHASREGFEQLIANVREVSNRIGILMDTKGPEVRTTKNAEDTTEYKTGDRVKIIGNPEKETVRGCIYVTYPNFVNDLSVGAKILIDDGDLELRVTDKDEEALYCEVCNDATLASRKSVNVPGVRINLPSLTEKDRNNILYAIEKDIDFIAHSFVRNKQDVLDIREILNAYGSDIKIIAKIEKKRFFVRLISLIMSLNSADFKSAPSLPSPFDLLNRGGIFVYFNSRDLAAVDVDDLICHGGKGKVVGDYDYSHAVLAAAIL